MTINELKDFMSECAENVPKVYEAGYEAGVEETKVTPHEWEHMGAITVAPDENGNLPTNIIFSKDMNGNPLELDGFYIVAKAGATDGASARVLVYVSSNTQNNIPLIGTLSLGLQTSLRRFYVQFIKNKEWQYGDTTVTSTIAANASIPNANIADLFKSVVPPYAYKNVDVIKKIELTFNSGTAKTWVEGSTFELYGVRKK